MKADCDLFIIGGGVNGCGIARDAAGRGLSVILAEKGDLGSATSSSSTKLFHGGLRYLEYFEFRLVRESLIERERLLRAMPHISWPMRFVIPHDPVAVTSQGTGPFPWQQGRRPAWMIRTGLFLYDNLGGRQLLPGTRTLDLSSSQEGKPLSDRFIRGFEYSDCWVEDSRLVVLNARDAAARSAEVMVRTIVRKAQRQGGLWEIEIEDAETGSCSIRHARALVNAGGPWVVEILESRLGLTTPSRVRLVRGSHIVIRRLYDHPKCYLLQGTDGRVVFTIPYESDFTLVGTTDTDHADPDITPECSPEESRYLLDIVNQNFRKEVGSDDIVWTYSGVRPLHDDGAGRASAVTRDYSLELDVEGGAPVLNVFGGKITTYRKLAEQALDRLAPFFPSLPGRWTADAPLPGGGFPVNGAEKLVADLIEDYAFLSDALARRLVRAYGTEARLVLGNAGRAEELGPDFGAGLTGSEVDWLVDQEFARSSEDILWRRSKLGLRLEQIDVAALESHIESRRSQAGRVGSS